MMKNVIVANYSGGNIAVLENNDDGSIGESKQVVQHYGKEVMLKDKRGHTFIWFIFPDRKFVLSNDLGMTRCILIIQPNRSTVLKVKDSFAVEAGSGPRHLTFKREVCFVLQELTGGLTVFSFERKVEKSRSNNYFSERF
jgi:6-phosphogluconolactonase